jgi:hypothetical protein
MIWSRLPLKIAMESNAVQPQKVFVQRAHGICFQCQIGTVAYARSGVP